MIYEPYQRWIEARLTIVNKDLEEVPFLLNPIQSTFVQKAQGRDIILKARQQGFSSFILGAYTADFLMKENSRSVIVADSTENAQELLDRVKLYIKAYERITKTKVPLKYNSKNELFNNAMNSRYTIGTAGKVEFGRSKTISNLHLSEAAFYPHLEKLLAGALQAVVPNGKVIIETTANGYNAFKQLWDSAVRGGTSFTAHFFKASDFYPSQFLAQKREELGRTYPQEYPESPEEAFITSGNPYFNADAMKYYLDFVQQYKPMRAQQEIFA